MLSRPKIQGPPAATGQRQFLLARCGQQMLGQPLRAAALASVGRVARPGREQHIGPAHQRVAVQQQLDTGCAHLAEMQRDMADHGIGLELGRQLQHGLGARPGVGAQPAGVRPYAGAAPQALDHGIAAGVAQRDEGRAAGNNAAHGLHPIGRTAHPGRIMRWAGEHMLVPAPDPRGRCQAGSLQRHGFIAGVDQQQLGAALGHGGDHALLGRGNGGAHRQAQAAARHVGQARPDAA